MPLRVYILLLTGLIGLSLSAQLNFDYTAGKFMVKGSVIDIESHVPVPFANILITNTGKGITCDDAGNFTIYVSIKDTLKFSSLGYLNKTIHIGDIDSARYYTLRIELIHDFIKLKEVTIYPFRDMDEFKQAFVQTKMPQAIDVPGMRTLHFKGVYRPHFDNTISLLYDRIKRRAANPDFEH